MLFSCDAHQEAGQLSYEDPAVNKETSLKFRIGTLIPTVSSKEGQHLKSL
jgi:hypothetical protein